MFKQIIKTLKLPFWGLGAFFLFSFNLHAQSWQWGKSGGGDWSFTNNDVEQVYSMVADSHKNVYVLSKMGGSNARQVDGHPVDNIGPYDDSPDVILASFACDGSYRWHKLFSSNYTTQIPAVTIDAQDNLYLSGTLHNNDSPFGNITTSLDTDIVFPAVTFPTNDYNIVFTVKYNYLGAMQWFKRLYVSNSFDEKAYFWGMDSDTLGNTYNFTYLKPGVYCQGALTVPGSDPDKYHIYIIQYDSNGNFVSGTALDINIYNAGILFKRNPYNGAYYFAITRRDVTSTVSLGGNVVIPSAILAKFEPNGQFAWKREDTHVISTVGDVERLDLYGLEFDSQNNIYIGMRLFGAPTSSQPGWVNDSFLGLSYSNWTSGPTLMKTNPDATTMLWSTVNAPFGMLPSAYLKLNGNVLGYTDYCAGANFSWGGQTISTPNVVNQGTVPLLARFNKDTGACIGLHYIPNDLATNDSGSCLAVDASGDYIMGGHFGSQLTVGANTLTSAMSQGNFFVAKFSTTACSPLEVASNEIPVSKLVAYPNPMCESVKVSCNEPSNYAVYSLAGARVLKGIISPDNNIIDVSSLAIGEYTITTITPSGEKGTVKVLKN